jgi:hypothetical protein
MSSDSPSNRRGRRFGGLNNISSNFFSSREKILDVTEGILDPLAQIAQSMLENSYTVDSLSRFGNTFNARVIAVTTGPPARHQYPDLYSNSTKVTNGRVEVPEYYICVLTDETDDFTPDPDEFCTNAQSYVSLSMMKGSAISEKPLSETLEPIGAGDIVEVYKPNQNSWNGAKIKKVVVRNNFNAELPPSATASRPFLNTPGSAPFSREPGSAAGGDAPAGRSLGPRPAGLVPADGAGRIIVSGQSAENSIPMYGNVPVRYRLGNNERPMDLSLPHRGRVRPIEWITIHNCGWGFRNGIPGATKLGKYLAGEGFGFEPRQVSGHIGIDEQGIEQYLPLDLVGFHGGPQNGYSVGIDICQPYDPEIHADGIRRGNEMTSSLYTTGPNPTYDIGRGPQEIVNISERNLEHTAQLLVALHMGIDSLGPPTYASANEITNGRGEFTVSQIRDAGWTIVPHSSTSLSSVRYDISQWWDLVMQRFAELWPPQQA